MSDTLLSKCICGSEDSESYTINDIPVLACNVCGVMRQDLPGYDKQKYFDYYRDHYHTAEQVKIGHQAYSERYEHDCRVAEMRLKEYTDSFDLVPGAVCLDIGSSNNAFVDTLNRAGHVCKGIEIGEEGRKHLETTYCEDLLELALEGNQFHLITLHDVFEHLINPLDYLDEIKRILRPDGYLVIDLPDYFIDEGLHHWRPVQHLWFFNKMQTKRILQRAGFRVLCMKKPIASKLIFYCEKGSA